MCDLVKLWSHPSKIHSSSSLEEASSFKTSRFSTFLLVLSWTSSILPLKCISSLLTYEDMQLNKTLALKVFVIASRKAKTLGISHISFLSKKMFALIKSRFPPHAELRAESSCQILQITHYLTTWGHRWSTKLKFQRREFVSETVSHFFIFWPI